MSFKDDALEELAKYLGVHPIPPRETSSHKNTIQSTHRMEYDIVEILEKIVDGLRESMPYVKLLDDHKTIIDFEQNIRFGTDAPIHECRIVGTIAKGIENKILGEATEAEYKEWLAKSKSRTAEKNVK